MIKQFQLDSMGGIYMLTDKGRLFRGEIEDIDKKIIDLKEIKIPNHDII